MSWRRAGYRAHHSLVLRLAEANHLVWSVLERYTDVHTVLRMLAYDLHERQADSVTG